MKAVRLVIIAILSVSMIAAGIFTVTQINGKSPAESIDASSESDSSSTQQSDSTAEQPGAPLAPESEADPDSTAQQTEEAVKIVLDDIVASDTANLDNTAVTWGPGVNFNDKNQPAACVTLQEKYGDEGAVFLHGDERIYLTFDLGYESGYTNAILDTLKANNVKATFFVTGSYAKNQEDIVKRIIAEGHTVGNHSSTHPDMTTISPEEAAKEINAVYDTVKEKYGYETYLFRFPAGTFSRKTLAIAAENGHHSVFWSFAYNDWDNANQPDAAQALQKVCDRLHPGAVYLLHPMETNSIILDDFIKSAIIAGYEIGIM